MTGPLYIALVLMATASTAFSDQKIINYIADNLRIRYDVISNFPNSWRTFDAKLTLTNSGDEDIAVGSPKWSIYFCHIRLIEPESIRTEEGIQLANTSLKLYHENGCQHRIEPTDDFQTLLAGSFIEVIFRGEFWLISRTDVMPNWYVASEDSQPRIIRSTAPDALDFVGAFDSAEKWKRIEEDTYNPYTAPDRFATRDYSDNGAPQMHIVPTPVTVNINTESFVDVGTGDWVVVRENSELTEEATFLADRLNTAVVQSRPVSHFISINVVHSISPDGEFYSISIVEEDKAIYITGSDRAGVFYGIQSLLSLRSTSVGIPTGNITDYPRFPYRGMHVDVSRNFHNKASIMGIVDVMAMYKLNRLHLHLTDDEGWRLEIPSLPELTQVGGQRCHDPSETICLMPQLGSGPNSYNSGSGYYTVGDYREILMYANKRHIQVIPEFDMPGHARAAIKAMEARYNRLKDINITAAEEYLLSDLDDVSKYLSVQYFMDNAINPCLDSTYLFISQLLQEVKAMHEDIQPLSTFHFGGDEVPPGAWLNSSACWKKGLTNSYGIKSTFIERISEIAASEGLTLSGWEDGFLQGDSSGPFNLSNLPVSGANAYAWNNVWEWGSSERAYVLANANYQVILSHATHLYYDHPYEPDPEERGYYWATRISPARKTFGYMPDSIYDNVDVTRMGDSLEMDDICPPCAELEPSKAVNIIGMQGQLWSETVRTDEQLYYMIFPRLLALAERAWHRAAWEDMVGDKAERDRQRTREWEMFANTLGYKELRRMDDMGITYAVPQAGARLVSGNVLEANTEYPGLPIQYSSDDGQTWTDYKPGQEIPPGNVHIITRSADRSRMSRPVVLRVPERPQTTTPDTSGSNPIVISGSIVATTLCVTTTMLTSLGIAC